MVDFVRKPGEIISEGVFINTDTERVDISSFALEIILYEDIFSNVMTGSIIMDDAASLITELPIKGNEIIELTFRTPGFDSTIQGIFNITSISERTLGEKSQSYILHIISQEGFVDNFTTVSQKFQGKTDEVIANIFSRYLYRDKPLNVTEKHSSSISMVSPYWSPLKIINWISQRSFNNAPNVVFFESNKKFYLTSIEDLTRGPITQTYFYGPNATSSNIDIASKYNIISTLAPIRFLDVLEAQDFGYFSSSLVTHDITKKSFTDVVFNYNTKYSEYKHLDENEPFTHIISNPTSFRRVKTQQQHMFSENAIPNYDKWILQRNSLMYEASNERLSIIVPGRTDVEVGQVIQCNITKSIAKDTAKTEDEMLDPYLSGKYLITAIRHKFSLNTHEMAMEIMKDSFTSSL